MKHFKKHKPSYSEGVIAKKHLGQHFLTDLSVAERIAGLLQDNLDVVIEIGPGTGVMTRFLYEKWGSKLMCIELDAESVDYLRTADWSQSLRVVEGDFLRMNLNELGLKGRVAIIGNYPYNISTQIVFKILEDGKHDDFEIVQFSGMFQKEVAERLASGHGNKDYGITSVLLQAYFDCNYEFSVDEDAFNPPPKVKSGVIDCRWNEQNKEYSFRNLKVVVKQAFSQRRKTLSNALKPLLNGDNGFEIRGEWMSKRAEQLSVVDFEEIAILFANANR
jgi:16S rRNA (adenine1518-N6/adenine1519-N6)-dimethyltransferase